MASSGSPLELSRLAGSGWASNVTNGAEANAASADLSSVNLSELRGPSSASEGTVAPSTVDKVQTGTTVPSTALIALLNQKGVSLLAWWGLGAGVWADDGVLVRQGGGSSRSGQ
ncbi:hypothetical protein NCCP2495_14020 [Dietzia sp. NCCP-2495]|nr:hypothetical protein NCCP2495_14020 [Dietzia sp. NCCP-2495]